MRFLRVHNHGCDVMDPMNRYVAIAGIAAILAFTVLTIGFTIADQEKPGDTTIMETKTADIKLSDFDNFIFTDLWNQNVWGSSSSTTEDDERVVNMVFSLATYPSPQKCFRYMEIEWTAPDGAKTMASSWDYNPQVSWKQIVESSNPNQSTVRYGIDRGGLFETGTNLHFSGHMMWKENVDSNDPFLIKCTLGVSENGVINEYVRSFEYRLNRTG